MRRRLTILITLAACSHTDPFGGGQYAPTTPFSTVIPRQLTFSGRHDQTPRWTGDGAGVYYSFQLPDTLSRDACVGELPAPGGARIRSICEATAAGIDSTDLLFWPAPGPGNRLVYFHTRARLRSPLTEWGALELVSLAHPHEPTRLQLFPYTSRSGLVIDAPTHLQWMGASSLIYVGSHVDNPAQCGSCPVASGLEIDRLDLGGGPPVPIAGTAGATSAALSPDGTLLYYTIAGSATVYRRDLTTGTDTPLHRFAAGFASDVQVGGAWLFAVVSSSPSGNVAGSLYAVDLATDVESELPTPGLLIRHPALSPDGHALIVEAYPVPNPIQGLPANLWLYEAP